jgi:phage gpG-like protein
LITGKVTSGHDLPDKIRGAERMVVSALDKTMVRLALKMVAMVKGKLSGEVLKVRSGRLRRSITWRGFKDANSSTVTVGTNVKYAKTHELGLTIPAHIVRARRGKALKFMVGGKLLFRKQVRIPAVKMPKRSFLQASLEQMRPTIKAELEKALLKGFKDATK